VNTPGSTGPLGRPRGVGFGILMFIVTLGFYSWYWVFKTEEEMRQHTGEGLGGVLGLVIWIVLHPVMAFVIPSEIGKMYKKDGQEPGEKRTRQRQVRGFVVDEEPREDAGCQRHPEAGGKDQALRPIALLGQENPAKPGKSHEHRREDRHDGELHHQGDEQELLR